MPGRPSSRAWRARSGEYRVWLERAGNPAMLQMPPGGFRQGLCLVLVAWLANPPTGIRLTLAAK